jgi:DNA-binding helix-hairpin-helix protein with protein kinase domain
MRLSKPLTTKDGSPIALGHSLGRGGEGEVFEIGGAPSLVAKVYHAPADGPKTAKLSAIVRTGSSSLAAIAAWPNGLLFDARGRVTGILMPRLQGYSAVYHLYHPKQRRHEFPQATWAFLIHTARNVAAAFQAIHAAGHLVADVNQGNLTVSKDSTVKFIDCDSFQVRDAQTVHVCDVGVAHFTPPELQNRSFSGVIRSVDHDAFGMAVILFHLLFVGRHPFAGRYSGGGEMSIERAIAERRFAFSGTATRQHMTPPPHSLPLKAVGDEVAGLFEIAFGPTNKRPSPGEWLAALEKLQRDIVGCPKYSSHQFYKALPACPWCEIERSSGTDLFITLHASRLATGGAFDLQAMWKSIIAVNAPATQMPSGGAVVPAAARSGLAAYKWLQQVVGFSIPVTAVSCVAAPDELFWMPIIAVVLWFVISANDPAKKERRDRQEVLNREQARFASLQTRWQARVDQPGVRFHAKLAELSKAREEYASLGARYNAERSRLDGERRQAQLVAFLERYYIQDASIQGIGPGRTATLISYGVETAADLTPNNLANVPGIGPEFSRRLLTWRQSCEQRFRFDPAKPVDPKQVAILDQRLANRKAELERLLRGGQGELKRLAEQCQLARQQLEAEARTAARAVAQAQADLSALRSS